MNIEQGKGRRGAEVAADDSFFIQALGAICRSIKSSNAFIEGKHLLGETLLAGLVVQLRKHYETHYGRGSAKPRAITIPTSRLFTDYRVNGALHMILQSLLEGATVRELLPLDSLFSRGREELLPVLVDIEKALVANNLFSTPSVFFHRIPVAQLSRLLKIVLQHGGRIVSSEDKATHVVDWAEDADTAEEINSSNAVRVVRIKTDSSITAGVAPSLVQLHWLRYPDSYDEFMSASDFSNTLSVPATEIADVQTLFAPFQLRAKYFVSARFLLDCDAFNEWGNETDYETPQTEEDEKDKERPKSKRRSSAGAVVKKETTSAAPSSDKAFFADMLPPSLAPSTSASTVIDLTSNPPSMQLLRPVGASSSTAAGTSIGDTAECKEDASSSSTSVLGKRSLESSSWLDLHSVSDVERRYLSALLADTSTASLSSYISIRNAIISFSAQNPQQYLSATECRRKLAADASKVVRIHEFLDAFGVINAQCKTESRPTASAGQTALLFDDMSKSLKRQELLEKLGRHPSYALRDSVSSGPAPTASWTVEMDATLVRLISSRKKDWRSIAAEMARLYGVTLIQCMMRFLEMPFSSSHASSLPTESSASQPPAEVKTETETVTAASTGAAEQTEKDVSASPADSASAEMVSLKQELPPRGFATSKEEVFSRAKQAMQLVQELEKLIAQLRLQTRSEEQSGSNESTDAMSIEDSAEVKERIAVYESMALHLRAEVQKQIQAHIAQVSQRIEGMLDDYVATRIAVVENQLKVFEHVENALLEEREQLETDKQELMIQKLQQGIVPSFASSSASAFGGFSSVR